MKSKIYSNFLIALSFVAAANYIAGCSGRSVDDGDPASVYKDAEEEVKDKRYTVALEKLKTVKNKFPYSPYSTIAQLRIADVYFLEESFVESAAAYEAFRDMHPKNEKADYVIFRIGESYYNQLPGGADRDLIPGTKAIDAYRELASMYPKSQYLDEAKKHSEEATKILAEKEKYIADFYFKRDMFDSAATRYEKITTKYPGTEYEEYAYWRWGKSLIHLEKIDEAKHAYKLYLSRFPSGKYAKSVGDWLEHANKGKGT